MAGLGGGEARPDDFMAELARWSAADRTVRAASERARTRDLLAQAAAGATWSGLLVDLAEAATEVVVWLDGGVKVTGRLVGTGRDFVVVHGRGGRPVLVRTDTISALAPVDGAGLGRSGIPGGSRSSAVDLSLAAALDTLAAEGSPVRVHSGTESITGKLVACGEDVVTIQAAGDGRKPVYLPLGRVRWVELG